MNIKCPSCGSEISFIPPPNVESLPDGYKHRIMCPYCGITIGVSIKNVVEQQDIVISSSLEDIYDRKSPARKEDNLRHRHRNLLLRSIAVVSKSIIITLFVCACILVAVGIAAFVLYMLSASDKIALSSSMERLVDFFWVYGTVGIVAGLLLFWLNTMIDVKKKDDDEYDNHPQSSSSASKSSSTTPKSSSSAPTHIYMRPPNILDKLTSRWDNFVGRGSYVDDYNRYINTASCGGCRWYEAGDAQGYAPGYCRYHSRTALWGDDACGDYE